MELRALTRDNDAGGVDASVLAAVDVTGLDAAGLDGRLRDLGRVQSRVSGLVAQVVAEKKRRSRVGDTIDGLLGGLRISSHQARSGWAAPAAIRTSLCGPPSKPATGAASTAESNPNGASRTTSSNGNMMAPPSPTTSCWSATPATTKSTTTTVRWKSTPTPGGNTSDPPGKSRPSPRRGLLPPCGCSPNRVQQSATAWRASHI